jgi:general secretion pathway protein K
MKPGHGQRGVAVIIALVILAIAATLSAAMLWDRNLDLHRTANILHLDQARQYLLGAEDWSEQILARDAQHSQTDSLGEKWATHLPALPIEGGALSGRLIDMQGRFNLNSLGAGQKKTRGGALAQFKRLLTVLKIDPSIANAVADWIDADLKPRRPGGAEDGYYAALKMPYLTADQPMASVSELLLVKGVTWRDYQRLRPYVAALPPGNLRINVNTAPWPVIASLGRGISPAEAKELVAKRGPNGFQSIGQFRNQLHEKVTSGAIGLASRFFRLKATVRIGSSSLTLYSLLKRGQTGAVYCIRRSFGTP